MFSRFIRSVRSRRSEASNSLPLPRFTSEQIEYKNYQIGRGTYGSPKVHVWQSAAKLSIGKYCSIASGVQILLGGEHRTSWVTTFPFAELIPEAKTANLIGYSKGDVTIGNDVWIGHDALILSGVNIGHGAVVGAGSVVTKDVQPYAIVAGNPARFVRFRIAEAFIPQMLDIKWWNWAEEEILKEVGLLLSADLGAFVAKFYRGNTPDI